MALTAHLKTLLRIAVVILFCVVYPVLAYQAAQSPQPSLWKAFIALCPLLAFASYFAWQARRSVWPVLLLLFALGALWAVRAALVQHYNLVYLLQHVGIYTALAFTFGRSLLGGRTALITRMAWLVHETMSPRHIRYTREVTAAWVGLFLLLALTSLLLYGFAPLATWSWFANFGTPLLMLLMFIVEYAVRCTILPAEERGNFSDTVRAIRRHQQGTPPDSPTHTPPQS